VPGTGAAPHSTLLAPTANALAEANRRAAAVDENAPDPADQVDHQEGDAEPDRAEDDQEDDERGDRQRDEEDFHVVGLLSATGAGL
jgi:hypothetical protein